MSEKLCVGAHISISGSFTEAVYRAQSYGCECMQIFTKSPRTWAAKPITSLSAHSFRDACKSASLSVFAHGAYLANPASSKPEQIEKSISSITTEILRCEMLHISYLVLHCGHGQDDTQITAFDRVISCLTEAYTRVLDSDHDSTHAVMMLMENSAGEANSIGSNLNELADIIHTVSDAGFSKYIGACFDTCHAYAAGYSLNTETEVHNVCDILTSTIDSSRLHLIHLNDAQYACGSGRDKHLSPGTGQIGESGFAALLRHPLIRDLPLICEVPIPDSAVGQALMQNVRDIGKNVLLQP